MIIMSDGEKIKRKIYISNGLMGKYVGRKKKNSGDKCDTRKLCGTYGRTLQRKTKTKE